jgi:hypothetical protein
MVDVVGDIDINIYIIYIWNMSLSRLHGFFPCDHNGEKIKYFWKNSHVKRWENKK